MNSAIADSRHEMISSEAPRSFWPKARRFPGSSSLYDWGAFLLLSPTRNGSHSRKEVRSRRGVFNLQGTKARSLYCEVQEAAARPVRKKHPEGCFYCLLDSGVAGEWNGLFCGNAGFNGRGAGSLFVARWQANLELRGFQFYFYVDVCRYGLLFQLEVPYSKICC